MNEFMTTVTIKFMIKQMSLPRSLCLPRWKNPQHSAWGFYGSSPISLTALAGPSSFPRSLLRCRKHSGQQSPPQTHTDPVPHSVTLGCSSKYRGRISLQYTPMAVILLETGTRGYWELVREQSVEAASRAHAWDFATELWE